MDSSVNVDRQEKQIRLQYDDPALKTVEICSPEYKSGAEIAKEINKSEKYLKNNILPKMTATERLTKLHSDNHPNQMYISKKQ